MDDPRLARYGLPPDTIHRLLDDTEDYGPELNRTIWILAGLAALFLGLRIYCKIWRRRSLWWDDYLLIASWIALAVSASMQSVCVSLGLGKHNRDIDPKNISGVAFFSYAAGFANILAVVWSKTSFALTLLRISDGWVRKLVWFIIVTVNVVLGINGVVQWVQCWPVEKLWHPAIHGKCWPSIIVKEYNTFSAAYSGAMDIVLAILPWKIIWHATINKKEKMGALFAMSIGVFAGITSFLKITTLGAIGNADIATTVNLFIFGVAEAAITIMAASIPILRALVHRNAQPPPPGRFIQLDDNDNISFQKPGREIASPRRQKGPDVEQTPGR